MSDRGMTDREPLYFHWRCGFIRGFWPVGIALRLYRPYMLYPRNSGHIFGRRAAPRRNDLGTYRHTVRRKNSTSQPMMPLRRKFHWKRRGQEPDGDRARGDPHNPGLPYDDCCRRRSGIRANIAVRRPVSAPHPHSGARNGGVVDLGVAETRSPLNGTVIFPVPHCNVYQHVSLHPT
jgi:hypothetical protein